MPGRRENFERIKCLHQQNSDFHSGLRNSCLHSKKFIYMNN